VQHLRLYGGFRRLGLRRGIVFLEPPSGVVVRFEAESAFAFSEFLRAL
jgi:hypothetical protein